MCGLLAILRSKGDVAAIDDRSFCHMRDTLAHRGPDGSGLWRGMPNAVLGHRRLAVIAPGDEGAQPMSTPNRRYVLVYNGELYNDLELRSRLKREGVRFTTECDTETVLHALATWGEGAAEKLRGMYAFCLLDTHAQRALIGRDPLGVKPLYTMSRAVGGRREVIIASEPGAILAHPNVTPLPDLRTLSAYLTSVRPTLGSQTFFEGIETLRPGEWRWYDLNQPEVPSKPFDFGTSLTSGGASDPTETRERLADSVVAHLRSDVPMCALLSGGLDSSAICRVALDELEHLRTFCAGAEIDGADGDDLKVAEVVAQALGTAHTRAVVTRELFRNRWPAMVMAQGVPLSTPNEVAINHIARTLRSHGNVVTLSGEGADELLAGYEPPLRLAAAFEERRRSEPGLSASRFQIESNQWVPPHAKRELCTDTFVQAIDDDEALFDAYERDWDSVASGSEGEDALAPHLRFQRRVNLENLLRRLDTATMLASVEGRTPFADASFAAWAEGLPVSARLERGQDAWRTKVCLREAFRGTLPEQVIERPKASFPLPFQGWLADHADTLRSSSFARELFRREAIDTVATHPEQLWTLAWPMINVAIWGERWWG